MKTKPTKLVCTLSNKDIKAQFKLLVFDGRPRCPRCGYTKARRSENLNAADRFL